jgi:hypothetical protein
MDPEWLFVGDGEELNPVSLDTKIDTCDLDQLKECKKK